MYISIVFAFIRNSPPLVTYQNFLNFLQEEEEEETKVAYDPYDMLVRQMTYERKEARGSGNSLTNWYPTSRNQAVYGRRPRSRTPRPPCHTLSKTPFI